MSSEIHGEPSVRHVLTILAVADVARAVRFYREAFGWAVAVDVPVYVELALPGGMRLGLYERRAFGANTGRAPAPLPAGEIAPTEIYLLAGDLERAFARAAAAPGGRVLSAIAPRPWGDDAGYLADPDGNVVAIARPRPAIRPEQPEDRDAVQRVNERAFGGLAEANLVRALREARVAPLVSLVAVAADDDEDAGVIGHILFSPVALDGARTADVASERDAPPLALGPMSVEPERQRRGVGSALVRAGIEACRQRSTPAVFVLGHPSYYPRFGFVPAADFGFRCEFPAPREAFLVLELEKGWLAGNRSEGTAPATVRYHAAFESV